LKPSFYGQIGGQSECRDLTVKLRGTIVISSKYPMVGSKQHLDMPRKSQEEFKTDS
jgi:hypothetical protein